MTKRRFSILVALFALWTCVALGGTAQEQINPTTYDVTYGITLDLKAGSVSRLMANLPVPESNQYQKVVPGKRTAGGKRTYPETGETFVTVTFDLRGAPGKRTFSYEHRFEITLFETRTDFDAISILPYDKSGELYRRYTSARGEYVMPGHPRITQIIDQLGDGTDVVEFARKAYDYVAKNFTYKNPLTGLHRLDDIFANGGGDCGNLSSIFISILRKKGIPARHVVGRKPNGDLHIFSEFYLEGHGWVPVDVTYRMSKPDVDYFGRIRANDRMIVFSRDVYLTVPTTEQPKKVDLMQTYKFWWRGKSCRFKHRDSFTAKKVH